MKKATVALVRCESYDEPVVERAVREAVGMLPEFGNSLPQGSSVLLKVNLTQIEPLETAVTTHPAVVKAVSDLFKDRGHRVAIGEGSGHSGWQLWRRLRRLLFERLKDSMAGRKYEELAGFYSYLMGIKSYTQALTTDIAGFRAPVVRREELGIETEIDFFGESGILDAARKSGAELAYFDLEETVTLRSPTHRFLEDVPVSRSVAEAGLVVSVAKFKTHADMVLTGAIKNFFGIIPTPLRHTYHSTSKLAEMMGEMLVDVYSVVSPPPLVVCDAVMGMEGEGPLEGPPRRMGLIMASSDCVAHDAVMAALVGLDPMDVPVVRVAHEAGLGQGLLENIEVRGVPINEVRQADWDLGPNAGLRTRTKASAAARP